MPNEAKQFVHSIKRHAMHDIDRARIGTNTAMEQSLFSVGSMGGEVCVRLNKTSNSCSFIGFPSAYSTHRLSNR